jgi:hypothetical protein
MCVSFAHEFFAQVMRASYVMQVIRTNYSHKLRTSFLRKLYTPVMPCKSYAQIIYTSFAHEFCARVFCHAFNLRYVYRTDKFISPPLCPRTTQSFTTPSRTAPSSLYMLPLTRTTLNRAINSRRAPSRTALPDSPHHTVTHNAVIYFHAPHLFTPRHPSMHRARIYTQQSRSA